MKKKKRQKSFLSQHEDRIKQLVVVGFFVFVGFLYLHNMTRDIYSGDIGDLVTASCVFGVAHPPGYPLFTMLGGLLCNSPLPLPPVTKVALISVLASFLGLIIFYKFSYRVSRDIFISLLSTSILGFSYLYWLHAEIPEVFALNNFFIIILIYLSFLFYQEKKLKYLYLLAFFTGLSLTHHHTIVLLFPLIFLFLIKHFKFIFGNKKRVAYSFLFFFIGFLPYLYVPIAASHNPPINWDNATTINNFVHLILRKDYSYTPSVLNNVPIQINFLVLRNYFRTLLVSYSYQILFIGILGILYLFRLNKRILTGFILAFFFSGPFLVFYGASPVTSITHFGVMERFYTLSSVVFMFFVPYGFLFIKELAESRLKNKAFSYIILSYFLIVPFFLFHFNFPRTEISKTTIGNELANNVLSSLPRNSVLFVSGDTMAFNVWYAYYVLKMRPDVDIINPPGVGGNKYLDDKINEYHEKNPKTQLKDILDKTLEQINKERSIYTTYNQEILAKKFFLLPKGLIFEAISKKTLPEKETYQNEIDAIFKKYNVPRREKLEIYEQNLVTPEISLLYSNALVRVGDIMDTEYKDSQLAEHYYRRALWVDAENPAAYSGLALAQYKGYNDCTNSLSNMKSAISLYPIWEKYHAQLYILYKKCNANQNTLDSLKKEYNKMFNKNIEEFKF